MGSTAHLAPILRDEAMTRDLGDEEARILIEWLVDWAEEYHLEDPEEGSLRIRQLWLRGRAFSRFVSLWQADRYPAALQLAAAERFEGPLPNGPVDAGLLMMRLLRAETRRMREDCG